VKGMQRFKSLIDIFLRIYNPFWESVYEILINTPLIKGRHGLYHEIVKAAGQIQHKFGCYAWGTPETIYYIGSFSKDHQHGNYKSNLHGRVHNYLQNHGKKESKRQNTNLMVFENINKLLPSSDVSLFIYQFEYLEIGSERVEYSGYCVDAELVRAVEKLLTCSYRRHNQCAWNRE
jgi:hypothetical protein